MAHSYPPAHNNYDIYPNAYGAYENYKQEEDDSDSDNTSIVNSHVSEAPAKPFLFKSLFSSINNRINTMDAEKTKATQFMHDLKNEVKETKAYPMLKAIKKRIRDKYIKNKHVGKIMKGISKHLKDVEKNGEGDLNSHNYAAIFGGIFMAAAKYNPGVSTGIQTHSDYRKPKHKKKKEECYE